MRPTDQQLLILQYQTSGGNVPSDFLANKIQILSCIFLPEYDQYTRETLGLSTDEVNALISDYIKMRPANDRVFNKILSVEYVFNIESNVEHRRQTALTVRVSEQGQAVADSGSAANTKRSAEITEQAMTAQATEKRAQLLALLLKGQAYSFGVGPLEGAATPAQLPAPAPLEVAATSAQLPAPAPLEVAGPS
jgi:hypothetical protein